MPAFGVDCQVIGHSLANCRKKNEFADSNKETNASKSKSSARINQKYSTIYVPKTKEAMIDVQTGDVGALAHVKVDIGKIVIVETFNEGASNAQAVPTPIPHSEPNVVLEPNTEPHVSNLLIG